MKSQQRDYISEVLEKIENNYGVYVGEKSVQRLAEFISTYELALFDITGVRSSFSFEFQLYIQSCLDITDSRIHWSKILCDNRSSEQAFDMFFVYWHEFIRAKKAGTLSPPEKILSQLSSGKVFLYNSEIHAYEEVEKV